MVVYDVYFGTSGDILTLAAEGIETAFYDKTGLDEGNTYYWKIVARDDAGAETTGPVWHFTTLGPPPDLVTHQIEWDPTYNLAAGQTITFTASVENIGNGPVVDAFKVEFYVDGSSIGSQTVNPLFHAGSSTSISRTWTAKSGNHIIEVVADSAGTVVESFEENNTLSAALPNIIDPTPPELVSTVPNHEASLNELSLIEFTLFDQFGIVDDTAVIASVAVIDGSSRPVGLMLTTLRLKSSLGREVWSS